MGDYLELKDLNAYKYARQYSRLAWGTYQELDWKQKKIIGDQMIRSVDSVGANIAEGYGRFHYLDKNKFYYNARGSLLETQHWFGLMREREIINQSQFKKFEVLSENIGKCLNGLISKQYNLNQKS